MMTARCHHLLSHLGLDNPVWFGLEAGDGLVPLNAKIKGGRLAGPVADHPGIQVAVLAIEVARLCVRWTVKGGIKRNRIIYTLGMHVSDGEGLNPAPELRPAAHNTWKRVKATPTRRSSSCRASTASASS
jgi:hypothetical protein